MSITTNESAVVVWLFICRSVSVYFQMCPIHNACFSSYNSSWDNEHLNTCYIYVNPKLSNHVDIIFFSIRLGRFTEFWKNPVHCVKKMIYFFVPSITHTFLSLFLVQNILDFFLSFQLLLPSWCSMRICITNWNFLKTSCTGTFCFLFNCKCPIHNAENVPSITLKNNI